MISAKQGDAAGPAFGRALIASRLGVCMNWEQFRNNVGARFQLAPPARSIDAAGNAVALPAEDDWILEAITPVDSVRLRRVYSGHGAELGRDALYDFRSDPARSHGGLQYGHLVLKMQVVIQGMNVRYLPNARPGEAVPSPPPEPNVTAEELFGNRPDGQLFLTRYVLTVHSPYPPANLSIVVRAPSIQRLSLHPQRAGVAIFGSSGMRSGMAFTNLQNPSGVLHLDVVTATPEREIHVEWDLQ